jgi:dienelactone hydrolase
MMVQPSIVWKRLTVVLVLSSVPLSARDERNGDERNTNVVDTNTHFAPPSYRSLAEWEAQRNVLRQQILLSAGLAPLPAKTPLHPQVFGRLERDGYSIERVLLETLPGYYLGGNLYRPRGKAGKLPGILIAHGHWDYGRLENQPLDSTPVQGISMARQGYLIFAYDMVGYNDTIQTPHEFGGPREQLWSFGPLSLQLWNSIRALDFLLSLDQIDPERVGITGASGGGTQTFLLTAVDDRIRFSAPVNMVSAIMQGGCVCENAPGLRRRTNNVEIAALAAPRPMILISGPQDWTKNVARDEYPAIRRIYELYGKADNVANAVVDAPHNYNQQSREHVYRFLGRHVLGMNDTSSLRESEVQVERLQDMLALQGRALPAGALDYAGLFARWRDWSRQAAAAETNVTTIRERLAWTLGAEWPNEVNAEPVGSGLILSRRAEHDHVPGAFFPGHGTAVLLLHPAGRAAAEATAAFQSLRKAGRPVLLIDAFQTGSAAAARDRSATHFLTFNPTDDMARIQDVLTALAYLQSRSGGPLELIGLEKASVWALFAAALAPADLKFAANIRPFTGTDEEFMRDFFVPGIQKVGGIDAAMRVINNRRSKAGS